MALHARLASATYVFQAYPAEWAAIWQREGLMLKDPTIRWGYANTGRVRWSDLEAVDEAGVLRRAAGFGLRFGMSFVVQRGDTRSIGSFAHPDRDFTEEEAEELERAVTWLHDATARPMAPLEHEAIQRLAFT